MLYRTFIRPILFSMDPEKAHDLAMAWAKRTNRSAGLQAMAKTLFAYENDKLSQQLLGLNFRNPVGIAAGFDKNGRILRALQSIGFGYIEIGSITAKPSIGNPRPRMFRLPSDRAIINRMGLNNDGADVIIDRLDRSGIHIPVGINIAKTHDPSILGDAAINDYIFSFRKAEEKADYIMVNISCPNTAEGITFEQPEPLSDLLNGIMSARKKTTTPVLVKFSPDVDTSLLESLVGLCNDVGVQGFALSNTSTARDGLHTHQTTLDAIGRGGLSGKPLRDRAMNLTRLLRQFAGKEAVVIGIGGIEDAHHTIDRLTGGANLVQIYTGLIYEGPSLPGKINRDLVDIMDKRSLEGISSLNELW
jgi:dihydroorotate dehydrogenase